MDSFLSNDNKGLLWSLLYEQGLFKDIESNEFQNVKSMFETQLIQISNIYSDDKYNNISLMNINKKAIQDMSTKIVNFKLKLASKTSPFINSKNVSNTHTSNERQEKFNKILETKQSEFTNLIQAPKPDIPKFSENMDEPFDKNNMDSLLSEMMNAREKELNQIMPNVETPLSHDVNNTPVLNIGSEVSSEFNVTDINMNMNNLDSNPDKKNKRVSFELESDNRIVDNDPGLFTEINLNEENLNDNATVFKTSFIDKLKKMNTLVETEYTSERLFNESIQQNNSTSELLNKIQANQSKLLELFNTMNTKQNTIIEMFQKFEKNYVPTNDIGIDSVL
jgi:hypothetical protein